MSAIQSSYTKYFLHWPAKDVKVFIGFWGGMGIVVLAVAVSWLFLGAGNASQAAVGVWVMLLVAAGVYAFSRVWKAATATGTSVGALAAYARVVETEGADRAKLLDVLGKGRSQRDDSHVAEALGGMAQSPHYGGGAQAASASAFARPRALLGLAVYWRTLLVLLGLAGTVFFFAAQLSSQDAGALGPVLDGLRAALASTLSGIVLSFAVGVGVGRLESELDELQAETEAFLGGPFAKALEPSLDPAEAQSEADLWVSLQLMVKQLVHSISTDTETLRTAVQEHALALQTVADQLSRQPVPEWPKQLDHFAGQVGTLSRSVTLIQQSLQSATEAMTVLARDLPSELVKEARASRSALQGMEQSTRSLEASQSRLAGSVSSLGETFSPLTADLRSLRTDIQRVDGGLGDVGTRLDSLDDAFTAGISTIERTVEGTRVGYDEAFDALATTAQELRTSSAALLSELRDLSASLKTVPPVKGEPPTSPVPIDRVSAPAAVDPDTLGRLSEGIARVTEMLHRTQERLDGVARVARRASRAPLARLLLLGGGT
jgi:hypothetical protein